MQCVKICEIQVYIIEKTWKIESEWISHSSHKFSNRKLKEELYVEEIIWKKRIIKLSKNNEYSVKHNSTKRQMTITHIPHYTQMLPINILVQILPVLYNKMELVLAPWQGW